MTHLATMWHDFLHPFDFFPQNPVLDVSSRTVSFPAPPTAGICGAW